MWNVCGRGEVYRELWWGNIGERDHLEDLSLDGRIMSEWFLKKSF
jgi:hypothetical protein